MTRIYFHIIISLTSILPLCGQNDDLYEKISQDVSKNIWLYRIKETFFVENNIVNGYWKPNHNAINLFPKYCFRQKFEIENASIIYPDTSFVLYSVIKNGEVFENDSLIYEYNFPNNLKCDDLFLIGMNESYEIKFLSGNFYHSAIADDFDSGNVSEVLNYIRIRLYQYRFDEFVIVKNRRKKIKLIARSTVNRLEAEIIVNKDDLDRYLIIWK